MKFAAALLALTVSLSPSLRAHDAAAEMATAANNLLASLSEEQRAKAAFELSDDERKNWHFIPKERNGLPLSEMEPAQRLLAHALLSSGMSNPGYAKAVSIMFLEQVLAELENNPERRNPLKYHISIFGTPTPKGTWGWRVEGHHFSANFSIADGKQIAGTPSFMAGNPDEILDGPRKGMRVLAAEDDLALELLASLNPDQRKKAIIADKAPADILTEAKRKVSPLDPTGLPASELTDPQMALLDQIISLYIGRLRHEVASEKLEKIKAKGADKILFAWAGAEKRFAPRYYRIQGASFLIEYANVQGGGNHSHAVWREFDGDFGDDILGDHIREAHQDK